MSGPKGKRYRKDALELWMGLNKRRIDVELVQLAKSFAVRLTRVHCMMLWQNGNAIDTRCPQESSDHL